MMEKRTREKKSSKVKKKQMTKEKEKEKDILRIFKTKKRMAPERDKRINKRFHKVLIYVGILFQSS